MVNNEKNHFKPVFQENNRQIKKKKHLQHMILK